MTYYRTCHNCAHSRSECATLARIKRGLSGLNVTSVKFNCPDRAPLYRVGDRVSVSWPVPEDGGYYDYSTLESWPATVIREHGPRFVIAVDDVNSDHETPARSFIKNDSLYCKVSAAKLTPLREASRSVCKLCGIVSGSGFDNCWQGGVVPDRRCLRVITASINAASDLNGQASAPLSDEAGHAPEVPHE